jgi:hypothetical protein
MNNTIVKTGADKLKIILQALADISEKNPRYWDDLVKKARTARLEFEIIIIKAGLFEQQMIEGGTIGHYGSRLKNAEELLSNVGSDLANVETEIATLEEAFLNGNTQIRPVDPSTLFALMARVPSLKHANHEIAAVVEKSRMLFESAKSLKEQWDSEHKEFFELQTLLKEHQGKLDEFMPLSQRDSVINDEPLRKARAAEVELQTQRAKQYLATVLPA